MNTSLMVGFTLVWDLLNDAIAAAKDSEPQEAQELVSLAKQKLLELEEDMRAIACIPTDDKDD